MSTTKPVNMAKVMADGGFTAAERAIAFRAVRAQSKRYEGADIHLGTLPFLDAIEVANCLSKVGLRSASVLAAKVRMKVNHTDVRAGTKRIPLHLVDYRVYKRFGKHPERGVRIPGLMPELRKRERKMFERESDAVDALYPIVMLQNKRNYWVVSCPIQHADKVVNWLVDNCG